MYALYCNGYSDALVAAEEIQQNGDVASVVQSCSMTKEAKGLSLQAFLIKPVQRICKYPLLLRDIIQSTPEGHEDMECLQSLLTKVRLGWIEEWG
jgi:hypothetical protein